VVEDLADHVVLAGLDEGDDPNGAPNGAKTSSSGLKGSHSDSPGQRPGKSNVIFFQALQGRNMKAAEDALFRPYRAS
jgi:hypothetical protein